MEIRLVKYLADCGVAARRKADELIRAGRVRVNGRTAEVGQKIRVGRDRVVLDGTEVRPENERVTLMLNKPPGYLTTLHDPQGRPTVMDLIPEGPLRLYPVGRLDFLSEGLLLLTNDGELARTLTHPSSRIEKEYLVRVNATATLEKLELMRRGVMTQALGVVKPVRVQRVTPRAFTVTLTGGRKREIRELCAALELPIEGLRRVRIGSLLLGRLPSGEWRRLSELDLRRALAERPEDPRRAGPAPRRAPRPAPRRGPAKESRRGRP